MTKAYEVAERFLGMREIAGEKDNPFILFMLRLDNSWPEHDEVPWCSAFVNFICFALGLPRSKSLSARSWLRVGYSKTLTNAIPGDIVVLKRAGGTQGPEVLDAPGHVGFFSKSDATHVWVLGGNQGDSISLAPFPINQILGIRGVE